MNEHPGLVRIRTEFLRVGVPLANARAGPFGEAAAPETAPVLALPANGDLLDRRVVSARPRSTGSVTPTRHEHAAGRVAKAAQRNDNRTDDLDDDLDIELLRRIGGADREAFRQLYVRYHLRLSRFLRHFIGRRGEVEDVVNDAMLVVWQRAGTFRGTSSVSTWIFGISCNCALTSIRRSVMREKTDAREVCSSATVTQGSAQETEDRQILDQGLAQLPVDQRVVLVLAYYLDCSREEIAAIVQTPVNTVKTRMFHARRKLRTYLLAAADCQKT